MAIAGPKTAGTVRFPTPTSDLADLRKALGEFEARLATRLDELNARGEVVDPVTQALRQTQTVLLNQINAAEVQVANLAQTVGNLTAQLTDMDARGAERALVFDNLAASLNLAVAGSEQRLAMQTAESRAAASQEVASVLESLGLGRAETANALNALQLDFSRGVAEAKAATEAAAQSNAGALNALENKLEGAVGESRAATVGAVQESQRALNSLAVMLEGRLAEARAATITASQDNAGALNALETKLECAIGESRAATVGAVQGSQGELNALAVMLEGRLAGARTAIAEAAQANEGAMNALGVRLDERIESARVSLEEQVQRTGGDLNAVKVSLSRAENRLEGLNTQAVSQARSFNDVETRLQGGLGRVENVVESSRQRLANEINALKTASESVANVVQASAASDRQRTDAWEIEVRSAQVRSDLYTRAQPVLAARRTWPAKLAAWFRPAPKPKAHMRLETSLNRLADAAPANYPTWRAAYERGLQEYLERPAGSLSTDANAGALAFRWFVDIHARGRVLDVGCGTLPVPAYLADQPMRSVAGCDPIALDVKRPFVFAPATGEDLPWKDGAFDTVIVGTSLDHFFLLDRALDECRRVLKPGGCLLMWSLLYDSTPAYDPYGPEIRPPDEFHLFHAGADWFLPMLNERFDVLERIDPAPSQGFFACIRRERVVPHLPILERVDTPAVERADPPAHIGEQAQISVR